MRDGKVLVSHTDEIIAKIKLNSISESNFVGVVEYANPAQDYFISGDKISFVRNNDISDIGANEYKLYADATIFNGKALFDAIIECPELTLYTEKEFYDINGGNKENK